MAGLTAAAYLARDGCQVDVLEQAGHIGGVHEIGFRDFSPAPDAAYWWPTLTVVDGTIEQAPERAEEVIAQARRYADTYLR
jgi:flavin-dependent dehydrogenase